MNLAVAFALCGFTTYLVDADGNVWLFFVTICERVRTRTMGPYSRRSQRREAYPKKLRIVPHFPWSPRNGKYLKYFNDLELSSNIEVSAGTGDPKPRANEACQDDEAIETVIKGLYEAGVASNGIVIMDVGINPSHPIHRAALGNADAICVVLKAELSDIAQGKDWLEGMIRNLSAKSNKKVATEFIATRVKICYNMVFDNRIFDLIHKFLNESYDGSPAWPWLYGRGKWRST